MISNKISHYLTSLFIDNSIINANQKKYYEYCINFLTDIILFNVSLIIIGIITKNFLVTLVYIFSLVPLKMFAGGAHANSVKACNIISYCIYFFTLLIQYYVKIPFFIGIIINLILLFIINIYAPIVHPNKSISKKNYYILKKYCILHSVILILFFLLFSYKNSFKLCTTITTTVTIVSINQYIGILKYKTKNYYD